MCAVKKPKVAPPPPPPQMATPVTEDEAVMREKCRPFGLIRNRVPSAFTATEK